MALDEKFLQALLGDGPRNVGTSRIAGEEKSVKVSPVENDGSDILLTLIGNEGSFLPVNVDKGVPGEVDESTKLTKNEVSVVFNAKAQGDSGLRLSNSGLELVGGIVDEELSKLDINARHGRAWWPKVKAQPIEVGENVLDKTLIQYVDNAIYTKEKDGADGSDRELGDQNVSVSVLNVPARKFKVPPAREAKPSPTMGPRRLKPKSEQDAEEPSSLAQLKPRSLTSYATETVTEHSRASSLSLDGFSQHSYSSEGREVHTPCKVRAWPNACLFSDLVLSLWTYWGQKISQQGDDSHVIQMMG